MNIQPSRRALSIHRDHPAAGRRFIRSSRVRDRPVCVIASQQLIQIRPDIWQPADTLGWLARPNVNVDQANRRLLSEFGRRGLKVIDPPAEFRAAQRDGAELYGTVGRPLSPAGPQELADFVAPDAEAFLLSPKPVDFPHRGAANN